MTRPPISEAQRIYGRERVAQGLAQIMAARHPGTVWVSAHDPSHTLPGQTIRRTLTGPPDDTPLDEGGVRARRAA